MLIRHIAVGLLKLGLIFIFPAWMTGSAISFFGHKNRKFLKISLLTAFFLVVEAAVLIEKGLPFFFGNIYGMVSMTPKTSIHLCIGLLLDATWVVYAWYRSDKIALLIDNLRHKSGRVEKTVSKN